MATANRKPSWRDESRIYCTACHASEPTHPARNGYACSRPQEDGSKCSGTLWIWRVYREKTRPRVPAQVIPFPPLTALRRG